jgi:hypothetical protein
MGKELTTIDIYPVLRGKKRGKPHASNQAQLSPVELIAIPATVFPQVSAPRPCNIKVSAGNPVRNRRGKYRKQDHEYAQHGRPIEVIRINLE